MECLYCMARPGHLLLIKIDVMNFNAELRRRMHA